MSLLEMRPHIPQHIENLIMHRPQEDKDACDSPGVGLVESYVEGKAHILLRLRDRNLKQYFACIQRDWKLLPTEDSPSARSSRVGVVNPLKPLRELLFFAWRHGASRVYERDGQQHSMLVDIIQPVELPERVAESSLVWLDTVDGFNSRLPHALYLSAQSFPVFIGSVCDWKSRLVAGFVPGDDDQFMSQIIERSAEVIQGIAQYEGERCGDLRDISDLVPDLTQVFVGLSDDNIGVCFPEPVSSRIEILDVLFGPVQFC